MATSDKCAKMGVSPPQNDIDRIKDISLAHGTQCKLERIFAVYISHAGTM